MSQALFFGHRRRCLEVQGLETSLHALTFHGEENFSPPYRYTLETPSAEQVTTSCYAYGSPEYPIKTPLEMPEPKSCPK